MRLSTRYPRFDSLRRDITTDSLFGRSGKLRCVLVSESSELPVPLLSQLFGDSVARAPGVYRASNSIVGRPFSLIKLLPFSEKKGSRLGTYRVGFWPAERGRQRTQSYANPAGFIEVTLENQETELSEHFRLADFISKDQQGVWPKYLVLRPDLIDKLELVIAELNGSGTPVSRVVVLSGFRTPQYNARGVGRGGRARDSRHQFGDAADIFVDNDGNGRLDDLNRDGKINVRDIRVILAAVDRVEERYPELAGGFGTYRATRAHGPFAHIDVRGQRARWGRS